MTKDNLDESSCTGMVIRDLTDSYEMDVGTPKIHVRSSTPTTPHTGLSECSTLKDEKSLASIVASLVGERFSFREDKVLQLCAQLEIYFLRSSIIDEKMLSIMTDQNSWPLPRTLPLPAYVSMITIPVTMCMANIARYTEVALAKGFYMSKSVNSNDLVEFYGASKSESKNRSSSLPPSLPTESKVPIFKVPEFKGDTLKEDIYECEVVNIFGNNVMASFLTSRSHCNNHPAWSGAFASRLRDSLSHLSVLEYLATELEDDHNCTKVWTKIKLKFSTSDVKIT